MHQSILGAAIAAALSLPAGASAADRNEVAELRRMIEQMRHDYEGRMSTLETRLQQAEGAVRQADDKARQAATEAHQTVAAASPLPAAGGDNPNAFNPAVSLILSGLYGYHSQSPAGFRITGFHLPGEVLDEIGPQRGLSLAESELGIYANIDPYFYGGLNLAIAPDNSVSAEEAFIQTTTLSHGLTLKAGRFFSGIGYLNEQHAHTWDFVDPPLAYQAFLGGQFGDDGLELRWLAPTATFLELGAEVGRGAAFPGTDHDRNGAGAVALFAHLGGDVGDSHSWRAGLSWLGTSPRDRDWADLDSADREVTNRFSGDSRLWVLDGVWKWAPQGNATRTSLKLQGEYLRRTEEGTMVYDLDGAAVPSDYATIQSGWYLQGVYQFAPYWRVGLRTERLDSGSMDFGLNDASLLRPDYQPSRQSLMLDYSPSEFSRIRLQLAQDKSRQGFTDNQVFLQYQMSLGAHGAHKF